MKLSEMIAKYGDDIVQFQNLDECMIALNMNKDGITKITFGAEQPIDMNGTVKLGLVVWMDREKVSQIVAEHRAASPTPPVAGSGAEG